MFVCQTVCWIFLNFFIVLNLQITAAVFASYNYCNNLCEKTLHLNKSSFQCHHKSM